jgi:hypothetical protein
VRHRGNAIIEIAGSKIKNGMRTNGGLSFGAEVACFLKFLSTGGTDEKLYGHNALGHFGVQPDCLVADFHALLHQF